MLRIDTRESVAHPALDLQFMLDAGDPDTYEDIAWFFGDRPEYPAELRVRMQGVGLATMVDY